MRFVLPLSLLLCSSVAVAADPVDFARDIRPILADNCFHCHGPDPTTREAELRLDTKEGAYAEAGDHFAVAPGKPAESEVLTRIISSDPDTIMPPPDSGKALTPDQKKLIRDWIEQGATWQDHWSFITPVRPEVPKVSNPAWPTNAIDYFSLAYLDQRQLKPKSEADKITLLRRVALDLTGLPPTRKMRDTFLADKSPRAYENMVDRLLESPQYGEHMARYWLDAVRYGDTHGLHLDNYREMWPYRDWVINAFNNNMPFNRFGTEQLAGDLLPNATLQQQIASGYNRCNVTTSEGGSIREEVYVRNVVDRVETTGTVFLGLTVGCAVCHEHKYDPISQKEFYQLFAFFNSLDGNPLDGNRKDHAPVVRVPTPEQTTEIAKLTQTIADKKAWIQSEVAKVRYVEPAEPADVQPAEPEEYVWIDDAVPAGARAQGNTPWKFIDSPVFSGKKASTRTATGLSQHFFDQANPPLQIGKGDILFAYVYLDPKNPPKQIMLQWNDGTWEHRAFWGGDHIPWGNPKTPSRLPMGPLPTPGEWVRLEIPAEKVGLTAGAKVNGLAFTQFDGTVHWDKAGVLTKTKQSATYDSLQQWITDAAAGRLAELPQDVLAAAKAKADQRNQQQQDKLLRYFIQYAYQATQPKLAPARKEIEQMEAKIADLKNRFATTLVWKETTKPRDAFLLIRGQYDQRGDKVERITPAALPPMTDEMSRDRLGFANWLFGENHPLTARVAVNRYWQRFFGTGIVKTAEDFGSQGEPPSHPKLLDWLAVEFRESGWDIKHMQKLIVMSSTYRQTSKATPQEYGADPGNRWLARGPRFRLDAEVLRDQALASSGIMIKRVGGPSVKPPQPDGLWYAVGYTSSNTARFRADVGDAIYRRSVYTFWKRTSPPPQMAILDAPSREACTVRRERTNTPLQALLLLNEIQYFESARKLAERMMLEGGDTPAERAKFGFELVNLRSPSKSVQAELLATFTELKEYYDAHPEEAAQVAKAGGTPTPKEITDQPSLAAWTLVGNVILNLDETVTKE